MEAKRTDESRQVRFTNHERDFIYSVAMKYMKDPEKASDVTQDALLLAYRHQASFHGDSKFTTWLYRIAATTSLMHLRKERSQPQLQYLGVDDRDDLPARELTESAPSPEQQLAASESLARAEAELDGLGEKYGKIFHMRFADGYTETEIAKQLKLNVSTVKTRAYRARNRMKSALDRQMAA